MDWNPHCAGIIPCFNEAPHIGRIVTEATKRLSRVIVVDDGSTDATFDHARGAGADVIRLKRNSGKGAAMQRGWLRARELGFQWVLMLDGDGQHSPDDIPEFFNGAESSGARLVVGNRMGDVRSMPFVRRQVNRWMSRRISRMTGAELPDSQCGFRLAHLETLLSMTLCANRFEIESAMLAAFLAAGHTVVFVPIRTIYEGRASKINPLTDTWRWLRWQQAQRAPRPPLQPAPLRACSTMRVP